MNELTIHTEKRALRFTANRSGDVEISGNGTGQETHFGGYFHHKHETRTPEKFLTLVPKKEIPALVEFLKFQLE